MNRESVIPDTTLFSICIRRVSAHVLTSGRSPALPHAPSSCRQVVPLLHGSVNKPIKAVGKGLATDKGRS
jgi:hypothetical protein